MTNEPNDKNDGTDTEKLGQSEIPPFNADPNTEIRARQIGLRPTVAYIPSTGSVSNCFEPNKILEEDPIKNKDRARKIKEREEKEKAGYIQFNRYIASSMKDNVNAFFSRLNDSENWDIAILNDPSVSNIKNEMLDLQRRLAESEDSAQAMGLALESAELHFDDYKKVLARSAQQQLELERLKPIANKAARVMERIEEFDIAMETQRNLDQSSGWRRVLLWIAGVVTTPVLPKQD